MISMTLQLVTLVHPDLPGQTAEVPADAVPAFEAVGWSTPPPKKEKVKADG